MPYGCLDRVAQIDVCTGTFLEQSGCDQPDKFPFVLVGNKIDLESRAVNGQEVRIHNQFSPQIELLSVYSRQIRLGIGQMPIQCSTLSVVLGSLSMLSR